jgi:hypothetical protein
MIDIVRNENNIGRNERQKRINNEQQQNGKRPQIVDIMLPGTYLAHVPISLYSGGGELFLN